MTFELVDISGDAAVRVRALSLDEAFEESAKGMYSLITDTATVRPIKRLEVHIARENLEDLLVAWLNELLYEFDVNGFVGSRIKVSTATESGVSAALEGEEFDPGRHPSGLLIKAATYHGLNIKKDEGGFDFTVMFDI